MKATITEYIVNDVDLRDAAETGRRISQQWLDALEEALQVGMLHKARRLASWERQA